MGKILFSNGRKGWIRAGKGPRAWLAAALCWALLTGCVQDGSSSPAEGEPVSGGWVYESGASCVNTLSIQTGGVAVWQGVFNLLGRHSVTHVAGSYTGNPVTDGSGNFDTSFTNSRTLSSHALAYCGQWDNGEKTTLPFQQVAQAWGVDPGGLSYRMLIVPGGGVAYVGSDGSLADRFAIHLDGSGTLHGFSYADHITPPATLFHRNQEELIESFSGYPPHQVLNLPQQRFRGEFSSASPQAVVKTLLLNVNSAVEITLEANPESGKPVCDFVLYQSPFFVTPRTTGQPTLTTTSQSVRFNPGDAADIFFTLPFSTGGQSGTAYLVPLALSTGENLACGASVRAVSLSAVHVKERMNPGGPVDAFSIPIGTGPVFLLGNHKALPSLLLPIPLHAPGAVWEGIVLTSQAVRPPALGLVDLLGLAKPGAIPISAKLGDGPSGKHLNLFRDKTSTDGLGPLLRHVQPPNTLPISLPQIVNAPFSLNEGKKVFRLTLQQSARVSIASQGGLDTMGQLTGADGLTLAADRNGAADGTGFRIVRSLVAGDYVLTVSAPSAGGPFVLTIAEEPASPVVDENLEACLTAAGSMRVAASTMRRLVCVGMEISSLQGIEAYKNLTRFSLADNRIVDVSPLKNLDRLHSLALDGNPLESLAPLLSMTSLYWLSLERTPLSPGALVILTGLNTRLSFLNLSGATGIDVQDVANLKTAMPNTTIVSITGEILP